MRSTPRMLDSASFQLKLDQTHKLCGNNLFSFQRFFFLFIIYFLLLLLSFNYGRSLIQILKEKVCVYVLVNT